MMPRRTALWFALALVTAGLAGCIGDTGENVEQAGRTDTVQPADAPEVGFQAPQMEPHPAGDLPTVNQPMRNVPAEVPSWWAPPERAEVPETIGGIEHAAGVPGEDQRGASLTVFGSLAIVPGSDEPTTVYDISDPRAPEPLSDLAEPPAWDAETVAYPDGRLFAVLCSAGGSLPVYNLTDPSDPAKVTTIEPEHGTCTNIHVVPGTPFLYNAAGQGGGPQGNVPDQASGSVGIYDLSTPVEPELVTDFESGYSCSYISFYVAEDKQRAYCGGVEATQIWDIADPASPSVVSTIPHPQGQQGTPSPSVEQATWSHTTLVNHDATVLVVGDEMFGGQHPGCDVHAETGDQSVSGPSSNLWFYDISDEDNPELVGWLSPSSHWEQNPPHEDEAGFEPFTSGCNPHQGHLLPQEDRFVIAYFGAGVLVVDASDPANPRIVDQWLEPGNTNTVEAWYYQGYVLTGDLARGLDLFTLNGGDP